MMMMMMICLFNETDPFNVADHGVLLKRQSHRTNASRFADE